MFNVFKADYSVQYYFTQICSYYANILLFALVAIPIIKNIS